MKKIKINYVDFGTNFDPENHYFTKLLRTKYEVEISDTPDYLFYAPFGQEHHRFNGIRIFYTGENLIPNFNYCDYAFGFARLSFGNRYMRLPLWSLMKEQIAQALDASALPDDQAALKRDFCATVIGNSKQTDGVRNDFFNKLNTYKPVASGGRWNNTVGGPVPDKIAFQKNYKFVMAFENTYAEGYTTEKLLDAFAGHSVPIYYGDPTATEDFNPDAFINAHDFKDLDDLLAYVKKVDTDDALYLKMLHAPIFRDNTLDKYSDTAVLGFLSQIFDPPLVQAKKRHYLKPYADVDYQNMKVRDIKMILKSFVLRPFKKK